MNMGNYTEIKKNYLAFNNKVSNQHVILAEEPGN